MVEVFLKTGHDKRRIWSNGRPVLEYDHTICAFTVPGRNGGQVRAAVEHIRLALEDNSLANDVQESIDELDLQLPLNINNKLGSPDANQVLDRTLPDPASFDAYFSSPLQIHGTSSDTNLPLMPNVGDTIEFYWPFDDKYYPGTVVSHIKDGDRYQINYEDGEQKTLHFHDETWRGALGSGLDAVNSNEIQLSPGMELTSHEKDDVKLYFQELQHKEFLANHAQVIPAYVIHNA
ncbi:unnamed protein product [Agarophyton chilense]